jgi:hypothetical protein
MFFKEPSNKADQNRIRITGLTLLVAATISVLTVNVYGASLDKDPPSFNASSTEDIDISINPEEGLPINGSLSMSTAGITDYDINSLVPQGMSVIIQNDSVTVTSNEVTIAPGEIPIQRATSAGDGEEEG